MDNKTGAPQRGGENEGRQASGLAAQSRPQYYLTDAELNSTKFKLAKMFAYYFCRMSMCDANSLHQVLKFKWRKRKWFRFRRAQIGSCERAEPEGRNQMEPAADEKRELQSVWPVVVLLLYSITTVRLIIWLGYQFEFDVYTLKLERLLERSPGAQLCEQPDHLNSSTCQLARSYQGHIESSYAVMKLMGNPYVKVRFIIQMAILMALGLIYLQYMHSQILINYGASYRIMMFELLLEEAHEFQACETIIRHETRLVKNSSCNYVQAALQLAYDELHHSAHKSRANWRQSMSALQLASCPPDSGLARHLRDHQLLVSELKRLRRTKQLHPINRTSAEWRNQIVSAFVNASLANLAYSFLLDWFLLYFGGLLTGLPLEFAGPMDVLLMVELWIYFEIGVVACSYHLPAFFIHCQNQTRYIDHVIGQVNRLIEDNERDFVLALRENSLEAHCKRMNVRLLELFLEYRVFLAQVKTFTSIWGRAVSLSLIILFLTPFLGRLYGPYILAGNIKTAISLFSINTAVFADFVLTPICNFEHKGHRLYRALASLLAHAVELDQQARDRFQGRPIYMANTIEMIRKELNEPEQMLDHFLTKIPGFKATFPSLMELHFYYSVLNLALYCEIEAWKKLCGNLLDDPLQLFRD